MAEPNALFCVLKPDGDKLFPSVDAMKQHSGFGALWLRPGSSLTQAVKSIVEYAQLPQNTEAAFLNNASPSWIKLRDTHAGRVVKTGWTYCFRVNPPRGARGATCPSIHALRTLPLHEIYNYSSFFNVPSSAFQSFMEKSSTRDMCKQMVSSLKQEVLDEKQFCRDFKDRFLVAVHCGKDWWSLLPSQAGLLLDKETCTFFPVMVTKPGSEGFLQSGGFPLDDQDDRCLKELGLLYWITQVLSIKPKLEAGRQLALDNADQVKFLEDLKPGSPVCNLVFRVSHGSRELVMKAGYSPAALRLLKDLCIKKEDQALNETRILSKLQGCDHLAPPLFFTGNWDDRPVVLTELQGSSLDAILPFQSLAVKRLCKDLTFSVMELHMHGVAHADITPNNVGVYSLPEKHGGRCFYLYDFGCAVELDEDGMGKAIAVSPKFSASATIESQVVTLVTELVSVAYTCLYLAGVQLPWFELEAWGPDFASIPRHEFTMSLRDGRQDLPNVTCRLQEWVVFLLSQAHDASFTHIQLAARQLLHV